MGESADLDRGPDGPAALSRGGRLVVVLGDDRSAFRDSGVEVLRHTVTQLDLLRESRVLTYDQYSAGRWAIALWRAAGLTTQVTSRYEEWISGARGSQSVGDDEDDEAAPWRELLASLPTRERDALEALAMGSLHPRWVEAAVSALDTLARRRRREAERR